MTPSSKQIWYIIGAIAVVLLVGWALMNRDDSTDLVNGNTDTQATSTGTTPAKGGGTTVTVSGKLPAGWPADAPVLQSGAKITYSGSTNPKTGALGPTIVYTVKSTVQNASTYFKSQFTKKGWTFRGEGNTEGSLQLAATKDTRKITVSILESTPGILTVTVGIVKL